jgi:hypothetical protein
MLRSAPLNYVTIYTWDSAERAKLRMEAETKKLEVELKPCQRLSDYSLTSSRHR